MSNEDGTVWVVFDGDIYNAPDLSSRLEGHGHRFSTENSETDVLVHLYKEKGRAMLHELNGMLAFVIHHQRRDLVFGARDRLEINPLYYWRGLGQFAFASELKALLTLP